MTLESWMDMCVIGKIIERCDLWIILKKRWRMSRKCMGHLAKSDKIVWNRLEYRNKVDIYVEI